MLGLVQPNWIAEPIMLLLAWHYINILVLSKVSQVPEDQFYLKMGEAGKTYILFKQYRNGKLNVILQFLSMQCSADELEDRMCRDTTY